MMKKDAFPASVDHLHQMLHFVSENAIMAGFKPNQILQIELALEEAIVNIIEHGYKISSGSIEIHCSPIEMGLKVKLIDGGMHFNPLSLLEGPAIAGYGIPLITKIMDHLHYAYLDGQNIFTMTKFYNSSNSSNSS